MPNTQTHHAVVAPPRRSCEEGDALPDAVRAHRAVIVGRLLSRQMTAAAIDHILPGWSAYTPEGAGPARAEPGANSAEEVLVAPA